MILSAKNRGFFVEIGDQSTRIASVSGFDLPLTVEAIKEVPRNAAEKLSAAMDGLLGKGRKAGGYRRAVVGVYPKQQFVRRATLDAKKMKEPGHLVEVLTSQFRVEPEKMTLALISAIDGTELDPASPATKEVIFCGGAGEEFAKIQADLLADGVFPERLELGAVATLGAFVGVLGAQGVKAPALVLNLGPEETMCYILGPNGVDLARAVPFGVNSMIPAVQKELGLKDEEAAARLFHSNTFDFAAMGPALIKRLLKELQASIGFYEVQSGQSIGHLYCGVLGDNLKWLPDAIASALGVAVLEPSLHGWLESQKITLGAGVAKESVNMSWLGLFALMGRSTSNANPHATK